MDEDIYISTPEGIENISGSVIKLQKAVYGLKQASLTGCWTRFCLNID